MDLLQSMFPAAPADVLQAVLEMSGDDVNAATNFLLSNDIDDLQASMNPPAPVPPAAVPVPPSTAIDDADAEEDPGEEDGGEEEDEEEDEEEEPEPEEPKREVKRLRTVEPTPLEQLKGQTSHFVKFDGNVLRKTYLELLNLSLSRLAHTSVTLWSEGVTDGAAAEAMLEGNTIGWWVQHYPLSEVDHVWRVIVTAHQSKTFASVVNVSANSFRIDSGAEMEVRVLVKDVDQLVDLKRAGVGLLSVAPSSATSEYILFQRGPHKQTGSSSGSSGAAVGGGGGGGKAARELKTKLEEKSEYKLQKERQSRHDPSRAAQFQDPDRLVHQLYKVESCSPLKWVKLDVEK